MLRIRLFLNLMPLALALLAVGAYAIVLLSRLAHEVDVTVADNHRSAMAAQTMKAAVSGIRSSLNQAMRGVASATNEFHKHSRVFESNLSLQATNAHLFSESQFVDQLRIGYQGFHAAGEDVLKLNQRREQRQVFEREVVPRALAINLLLDRIGRMTQKNILATSQNIQEINRRISRLMILAIAVTLFISTFASFQTSRFILRPIQSLTRATREVGEGNLDQVVPAVSRDELGELAAAFNKMAAQLKAYRQSTAEKIVRLHHTMEAALASFPDPVFVLDRSGHIELKNRAAQELGARLGLNDGLPARLAEMAGDVLRTGEDFLPHSFKEALSLRTDGEETAFLPRILTMRGEKNEPVGVAVVLHDVTRFRLMDDAKTNLVATVSHELKTPLTSVRMVLFMLLEKTLGPLSRKQTESLQTARKEAERLLRILNDLLDLTRLEAGQSGLNRERVTPARLVQSISEEAQQRILEQGLILTCSVQPQLPEVSVDRQRISHVFQNFVSNAIKHSPPSGEIQVRAAQADGGVQFSIIDQGPGVPEEYQGRIFDRFFRVPGQTRTGAGLGLSIAREIAIAHGGRIGLRSEPGNGSEFYIVLPSADEESRVRVDAI
jgi:NtrC-family two-component system sensor histidine kinase KinB